MHFMGPVRFSRTPGDSFRMPIIMGKIRKMMINLTRVQLKGIKASFHHRCKQADKILSLLLQTKSYVLTADES